MPKKTFTAEESLAYAEKQQNDIQSMIEKIDKGVNDVFQSEKFREYLRFCSKFTDYSANNTMLIAMQKPDASLIASYKKWKLLGRNVERGSKGIEIFAPVQVKTNKFIEEERPVKDKFGNQEYNEDGTLKTEKIEKALKQLSFKKVHVFDVSQTFGKDLPSLVDELTGDIDKAKFDAILKGIRKAVDVPVEFENITSGAKGYYSYAKNRIAINNGMSDTQTIKTAFHEAAHCLLHNPQKNINSKKTSHSDKEIQAESTAFIIANKYGIDTSEYSFPYIASWANGKELSTLKSFLNEIQTAAREISNSIDNELLKLKKQDLSVSELISDTELNIIQKAEILLERKHFEKNISDEISQFAGKANDIREIVKKIDEVAEMQKQFDGYDFTYMNPIADKSSALAAFDKGESVYLLYPDNTEVQAQERSEIENYSGMFGTQKQAEIQDVTERDSDLIQVSKDKALTMYDKGIEVYVDGDFVENRTDIQSAPDTSIISVNQYQYSSELNLEKPADIKTNSNIIGNVSYKELGPKTQLAYFRANTSLTDEISDQLKKDGVKFSGLKKKDNTIFTVNKKDSELYQSSVSKVVLARSQNVNNNPSQDSSNIVGNISFNELTDINKHVYKTRVAESIMKNLSAENIPFSGIKQGATTVISISGENDEKLKNIVNKVKQEYIKQQNNSNISQNEKEVVTVQSKTIDTVIEDNSFKLDIFTQSYSDIKKNNAIDEWRNEMENSRSCINYINNNLSDAYSSRSLTEFINQLEKKYGLEKSMHIISATIQLKHRDGRFTDEVKKRASEFAFTDDDRRRNFLTEQHPVMLNHLFESMIDREKEINLNNSKEKTVLSKLNEYFSDKHIIPMEKIELVTDKRGFPQTVSKKTAVNERYIDGYGWLDNDKYATAKKESDSPHDFSQKVSKVCVSYVDDNGKFGFADIDSKEYDLFTQKTYSIENKEKYEAAKQKLESRNDSNKKTEYYAIRQLSAEKYAIITIGSDGTPDFVKRDISKNDAIKTITDIYNTKKKNNLRCEIVQPDKIDSLSIDFYKNQTEIERTPDTFYKVLLNPNKQVSDKLSHFVQEYTKDGDGYKASSVAMVGTYDECHALTEKIVNSALTPTYKIYQLSSSSANDRLFAGSSELKSLGLLPEFSKYKKMYESELSTLSDKPISVSTGLEKIYTKFNIDRPADFKGHSLSVSDVVVWDKTPYFVDDIGFKKLNNFTPEQTIAAMQENFMKNFDERINNVQTAEDLKAIADEAKSLGIDCDVELNKSISDASASLSVNKETLKASKRGI